MPEPINHEEAYEMAHAKRAESNLARCYLDLRKSMEEIAKRPMKEPWVVSTEVILFGPGWTAKAVRAIRMPFPPFPGLVFTLGQVTLRTRDVEFNPNENVFRISSAHSVLKKEEFEPTLEGYRKSGFDVFDLKTKGA